MAQLNITLNESEILLLMQSDREGAFAKLLQESLNGILKAESADQLQAEPYERSEARKDYRNGSRERDLVTRIGTITLTVPKHRNEPFKTMIFDNYQRSEAALIASMAEMVVNGVSTRKVANVVEKLCGASISKSAVSELCKELDASVNDFKSRPLEEHYPFVTLDATYFKVRENSKIISKAFMIAYGINSQGHREVLGFGVYRNESKETWKLFLESIKARGLKDVRMFISDAHEGIRHAISRVFPDTPWQRCQFHLVHNILDKTPKKYVAGLKTELREMFDSKTIQAARAKRDSIISDYRDVAESAMNCLDEGFDDSMTIMILPEKIRKKVRTSNHIERLNRELKRRSRVIGIFPNTDSLNRLMGAVLMEQHDLMQNTRRRILFLPDYNEVEAHTDQLKARAEEQSLLLAA